MTTTIDLGLSWYAKPRALHSASQTGDWDPFKFRGPLEETRAETGENSKGLPRCIPTPYILGLPFISHKFQYKLYSRRKKKTVTWNIGSQNIGVWDLWIQSASKVTGTCTRPSSRSCKFHPNKFFFSEKSPAIFEYKRCSHHRCQELHEHSTRQMAPLATAQFVLVNKLVLDAWSTLHQLCDRLRELRKWLRYMWQEEYWERYVEGVL